MKKLLRIILAFVALFYCQSAYSQQWQSNIVYFDSKEKLVYKSDAEGNKIPDFSYAGYKNGTAAIPNVPVVKTISPVAGDNTQFIQAAIDEVGKMTLNSNGIRGALLLTAGTYQVNGTLNLKYDGVVLRGVGDGEDPATNTIIFGKGNVPDQRTIIVAGGGSSTKWADQVSGTKTNIISQKVYVGDKSFRIANIGNYKVGDNIIIYHPCTEAWIKAVDNGGTATDPGWSAGDQPIIYNRYITKISVDTIFIDAPVFNTLDLSLSQSYIYKYGRSGIKTNVGIENLRVDIEAEGDTKNANGNEEHAWQAIELRQIEDGWVNNCTMTKFGQSGVMTSTATRITIDNCKAIDPISIITGERRYNFNLYHASQLILVKNCYTRYGRHDYVSNGTSTVSGCVFYNNVSEFTYSSSEGHRWWSQGLLYDNIIFKSPNTSYFLALYNRGDNGTAHGWSSAHSVAWNCSSNGGKNIIIQKPPTAQNYSIGCTASKITGKKTEGAPYDQPEGYIEGSNKAGLNPASLYIAQLSDRTNPSTSVKESRSGINHSYSISQNYPNPFNPSTNINYNLPYASNVSLKIYDLLGREIATLVNEFQQAGNYNSEFSILNSQLHFASGVYLYELKAVSLQKDQSFSSIKKMIYLK